MDKSLGNKIKLLRKENKLTQQEFSRLLNSKYHLNTDRPMISKWETGFQTPHISTLKHIASFFDVSLDYLNSMYCKNPENENDVMPLSSVEKNLIKQIRDFDETLRNNILTYVSELHEGKSKINRIQPKSKIIDFQEEKAKRELPYYTIGASAGNGNFLATNDYILIEVDDYVPQQANYALKVKGDSMEPKYHDGDIVYVKTQKSIENGEIGIFCIDDNVYIKKLECADGKCKLISLNPAYEPIEIKESNEFKCFGKVLN